MNDFSFSEIYNRRFWAKNDGAKVKGRQNGLFLERFSQFLDHFLQKATRFLQKSREMERFLAILKKAGSFSRRSVRSSHSRRKIRTYERKKPRRARSPRRGDDNIFPQMSQSIY